MLTSIKWCAYVPHSATIRDNPSQTAFRDGKKFVSQPMNEPPPFDIILEKRGRRL
jgi:hypothetical protein